MIELTPHTHSNLPDIMVIGIGGAGNNAVSRMIINQSEQVRYATLNTDLQVPENCPVPLALQIGGKLTVAVVTMPFSFESIPRTQTARLGLEKLKECVDTLLVIPNDKLLDIADTISKKSFCLEDAFEMADDILKYTISSITNIIFHNGLINLDFNDLGIVLRDKGMGHIGIGYADTNTTLLEAMEQAIHSPLLETSITGATNILINSSGRVNLSELHDALSHVRDLAGEHVNIIRGTVTDKTADLEQTVITLIATGMEDENSTSATSSFSTLAGTSATPSTSLSTKSKGCRLQSTTLSHPDIQPIKSRFLQDEFVIPPFLSKTGKR